MVGVRHADVAARVRETLEAAGPARLERAGAPASDANRRTIERARKLQRFLAQPFFVAEAYTKTHGRVVRREETVEACAAILDGAYDDLPTDAFYFVGGMDEVRAQAAAAGY